MKQVYLTILLTLGASLSTAYANGTTKQLLQEYQKAGASSFSAADGKKLWTSNINGRSCTTCHTNSVKNVGKHKRTGKTIQPMAPSVNSKRLTDKKKVKKWLLRNCKWTLKRECTAQEKGNILLWLSKQ